MAKEWKVDVICTNISENPHCFHGPTLKFRRKGSKEIEYFSCAACRDRTTCPFYQKTSDECKNQSIRAVAKRKEVLKQFSYPQMAILRKLLKTSESTNRGFCHTHNVLFHISSLKDHSKCNKIVGISNYLLKHPTEICIPKEKDKVEAQYFFSKESSTFLVSCIKSLNVDKIICMGTPRLHEVLTHDLKLTSLLLDIDPKYYNFYPKKKFIWYNMFNNFCFDEERIKDVQKYLKSGNILILLDPPFGGRVEPIAETLKELANLNETNQDLKIMWFFPYFMENHIKDSLPHFRMFDYQVNYENHSSFTNCGRRRRKAGSPVRIFTNIPLTSFDLSSVPGYKLCGKCKYWVHETNNHCSKCGLCTSKNGMRYIHCDLCTYCVKPSYSHCQTCQRCCLPSHKCGEFTPDKTCYHCHQEGHKKSQCPKLAKKAKLK